LFNSFDDSTETKKQKRRSLERDERVPFDEGNGKIVYLTLSWIEFQSHKFFYAKDGFK